jgi:putative membrane protein
MARSSLQLRSGAVRQWNASAVGGERATIVTLNVEQTLFNLLLAAIFSILGFILLFIGYRVWDALTPDNLGQEIFDKGNVAAAVLTGAFIIAIAIIVAASIRG